MERDNLIACHECDALFRKPLLRARLTARCPRCGAALYHGSSAQLDRICAMTLGALITFIIAQSFPILELDANGVTSRSSLFGALVVLWEEHMELVAVMVFCCTVLFPLTELVALLYVLLPVRQGHVPPGFNRVLRAIQFVRPWGMIEVFMLGVLVTIVKMVSLARVIPDVALFGFGALTLMSTVVVTFDSRTLWDIADELRARHASRQPGRSGPASGSGDNPAGNPGDNPGGHSGRHSGATVGGGSGASAGAVPGRRPAPLAARKD